MFYFGVDLAGFNNHLRCGTINFFDGWVYNSEKGNPIQKVAFFVESALIGDIPIKKERPDLESSFHESLLGFSGVVDIPDAYLGKILTMDAVARNGARFRMGEYPLTDMLTLEEKNFRVSNKLPSDLLIHLVVHSVDPASFLAQGKAGIELIRSILEEHKVPFSSIRNVLDFGVGCGRVIRWWDGYTDQIKFWGTDINPDLVRWCQENLQFGEFTTNSLQPPTSYPNNQFDLLYAFSVFTHLTIETQKQWLDEFARILTPGASLLVSVHGDLHAQYLPADCLAAYKKDGYYLMTTNAEGENLCASYQTREFSERLFSKDFRVLGFYPGFLSSCGHQDLFFLQKK